MSDLRPIAMYLPQYHPIPENDEWWGKGFTEWRNVTKAQPLFEGHYQPHLPADLGFYDLRVREVREEQARLARENGIYGFCYYHYWFNGKRVLERPFQEVFESGEPALPFMLCWANENWTRAWDGGEKSVLLEQHYNHDDDRNHIQHLIPYFKDSRYITIDNKPLIAIYRSTLLPDVKRTLEIWREEAAKEGLELYITRFESFGIVGAEFLKDGFDAAIDFQPLGHNLGLYKKWLVSEKKKQLYYKLKDKFYKKVIKRFSEEKYSEYKRQLNSIRIFDYKQFVDFSNQQNFPEYKWFPCVTPMWDNTPRRKVGQTVFHNSTPAAYKKWLKSSKEKFKPYSKEENLFFINAWNEWAEGNHLEPCKKWGRSYLDATKEVFVDGVERTETVAKTSHKAPLLRNEKIVTINAMEANG